MDPAALTLGQISSALRDFTVVGVLLTVAWKSRGMYESAKNFFERLTKHMDKMESGMETLLTNHLFHIEKELKVMARRQVKAIEVLQAQSDVMTDDGAPPPVIEA
jgi:hypothetical protein